MLTKEEAILKIIERGTGVIGPIKMLTLLNEAGITVNNNKVLSDDIDRSFDILTEKFAAIAPTTRITLLSLSRLYGFDALAKEKKEKKEKGLFLRLKNWKLFKR